MAERLSTAQRNASQKARLFPSANVVKRRKPNQTAHFFSSPLVKDVNYVSDMMRAVVIKLKQQSQ